MVVVVVVVVVVVKRKKKFFFIYYVYDAITTMIATKLSRLNLSCSLLLIFISFCCSVRLNADEC
jgi:hypothetical protein